MKKIIICGCAISVSLMFSGCKTDESNSTEESSYSSSESMMMEEHKFTSVDELAEFIIENKDDDFNSLFSSMQSNSSELTIYALKNLPDNYNLYDVRQYGNFISYEISENSDKGRISFVWGYNTEGDSYLKNAINVFGLKEMPNVPDFYYSEAEDDYGVHIYQIYWSQDGYCFQLNIPSKIFNDPEAYGLQNIKSTNKSELMDLEKLKYTLPAD